MNDSVLPMTSGRESPPDLSAGLSSPAAPIFIAGCGHSGTTLTLGLLGLHRNIYAIPFETHMFGQPGRALQRMETLAGGADPREASQRLCYRRAPNGHPAVFRVCALADRMAILHRKRRWVDKTPRHVYHIGGIFDALPDASVVLMQRDGRDVALSLRDRLGTEDGFLHGIQRWIQDSQEGEKHSQHPRVFRLRFEDLIEDLEGTLTRVCHFLGEQYDPAMRLYNVDAALSVRPIARQGAAGWWEYRQWLMKQPVFDTRAQWVTAMQPEEKDIFKRIAGEMLIRYGYAETSDW